MIPENFERWQDCITKGCGIELTSNFAMKRLAIYKQLNNPETREFIRLYGKEHHRKIIAWFEQIKLEK